MVFLMVGIAGFISCFLIMGTGAFLTTTGEVFVVRAVAVVGDLFRVTLELFIELVRECNRLLF